MSPGTTIAAALAATALIAPAAHAQESVTLYGLIDAGLMYTNNVGKSGRSGAVLQATSGTVNGSQFGVIGGEDLGGGLHAIFNLENGFNVQNGKIGQDNRLFGRQAYVGLDSTRFGRLVFGRVYDSGIDYVAPLSAAASTFGKTGFAHPFDNDNLDYSVRFSNAVKYSSHEIDGFRFGGMLSLSNSSDFGANRAYSIGASYANGPLSLGGSYLQIDGSNSTNTAGAIDVAESSANGTGGFVLGAGVERVAAAGLNYVLGPATLGVVYTHSQYQNTLAFGSAHGALRFDNVEVNSRYAVTPALRLGIAYVHTFGHLSDSSTYGADPRWDQIDAQAVYRLSKRTDLYAEAMVQHVGGAHYVAYVNAGGGASSTDNQVVATLGMRTRF